MQPIQILWVDDEVDLLKPHFLFLAARGYEVTASTNGQDALEKVRTEHYDVVLLDENMPGLNGLETLQLLKVEFPGLPVIMVTKNEEEQIMEEAIGSKISDYLIKPVNPNQILLSLKKTLNHESLVSEKTNTNYLQEFQKISLELLQIDSLNAWMELYKKLVFWQMELQTAGDNNLLEILDNQRKEANALFGKYVAKNYEHWINNDEVLFSNKLVKTKVIPALQKPTLFLVIDNLRWDQWKTIAPTLEKHYRIEEELIYTSLLPTATQYARNSLFAGMLPAQIKKTTPQWWKDDYEEGGKNLHEEALFRHQLERLNVSGKIHYEKITQIKQAKSFVNQLNKYKHYTVLTVVYNFVDMISHAKSEMEIIKELADNDQAYCALTKTWFQNSPLLELIQQAQEKGFQLILTTDHGTINTQSPCEVIGDRESSLNLRYKTGKSLKVNSKKVMEIVHPEKIGLPSSGLSSSYIFAQEAEYFVYPKNYHHFANLFLNTYQHGGISLEEMLIPFVILSPK